MQVRQPFFPVSDPFDHDIIECYSSSIYCRNPREEGESYVFCPKFKSEYRLGFTRCSDCNVELVSELPEDPEEEFIEYEKVLFSFPPADIAFIKSILDGEDIAHYFLGEQFTYVEPLAVPARLMVEKEQVERVKELLKDANLSIIGIAPSDSETKEEAE